MRSLSVILGICAIAVAIGCVLFFFGPPGLQSEVRSSLQSPALIGSTNPAIAEPVTFTVLEQGTNASSIIDRTNYRIDSVNDLDTLWTLIYGQNNVPVIPSIDFSKYEVLAVFDGTHSTTGYSIAIKAITDQNATRTVIVNHLSPGSACSTTSQETSPFELVEVPKTPYALAHQDMNTKSACSQ